MLQDKKKLATIVLSIFIAFVFVQSLFFKFSGAPETQHIFGVLNDWAAATFGIEGLFLPPGIFNAYVIGTAELVASILLIGALVLKKPLFTALGALMALGIITGAIFFHLATPLGVNVEGDGGTLFYMACGVWVSALILIIFKKGVLCGCLKKG